MPIMGTPKNHEMCKKHQVYIVFDILIIISGPRHIRIIILFHYNHYHFPARLRQP